MGRRWYLKFDGGQELELDARLWPVGTPLPLKDVLAYEREFHASPWVFLRGYEDVQEVPTSFWLYFAWRELQRQDLPRAGRDYVVFCEGLVDFRDLTTYPEADQAAEEGEGSQDPPGAPQTPS
jgi:hypothetical protein